MQQFITLIIIALTTCPVLAMAHEKQADTDIGRPGNRNQITRIQHVTMTDNMRFTPSHIKVKRGDVIHFKITNKGQIKHEMVLGSMQALREHAEVMRKFPDMVHDEPNQIAVAPGKTGEIIWHFTQAGKVDFACLEPGHYEAGMIGKIAVKQRH